MSWFETLFATIIAGALSASAATPDDMGQRLDQMQRQLEQAASRIAEQDAQIARLRDEVGARWMTERRAEQVKALVAEVLADAETRASLLDRPLTAGHDGERFFLADEDGDFLLKLMGQLQVRYVFSTSDDAADLSDDSDATVGGIQPTDLDNDRGGFELTRVRFGFTGHVIDPSWQFLIWTGHHYTGGSLLLDAWVRKQLEGGWSVQAGQFKTPFWHEWLISETRQQFVERSLVHNQFFGSYTQGATLDYRDERLHALVSLNDGLGGTNGEWDAEDVEAIAVTTRGEYLLAGDWSLYADFQAWRNPGVLAVLGAAAHWQSGEYGTPGSTLTTGDEATITQWTVDGQFECLGWGFYGAVVGRHLRDADQVPDLDQYAFVLQGSYFLTDAWELIGRYEWGDLDVAGVDQLSILTVGLNHYFAGHQVKLTTDVGYAFNALQRVSVGGNTFGWPADFHGYRPEADGVDGQIVVRSQLQLLF